MSWAERQVPSRFVFRFTRFFDWDPHFRTNKTPWDYEPVEMIGTPRQMDSKPANGRDCVLCHDFLDGRDLFREDGTGSIDAIQMIFWTLRA